MSTRTPAAIFDDVLDRWDDLERHYILNTPYPGDRQEMALHHHADIVRKLREEFREAMRRLPTRTYREEQRYEPLVDYRGHLMHTPPPERHTPPRVDDEDFRRRRDESAERYTRHDGSPK